MNKSEYNFRLIQEIEENRRFFLLMYEQNPELLKNADVRIRPLLAPLANERSVVSTKQRGISLVELIMFIVIISVAVVGILGVMTQVTRHSADPLVHKQALAAAESLLEEIELQDFVDQNDHVTTICPSASAVSSTNRASMYHIVSCYNAFAMPTGITDMNGNAVPGLGSYKANVKITGTALGSIGTASSVLITVAVTDPQGTAITLDGYRTAY